MATPTSTSQGERSEPATVDFSFCATADSPRNLITILSAFHHPGKKKKLFCNVTPSARGIDMMWEDAKSLQAHVFLSKELFTDYRVRDQQQSFKISLTDFLEILQIFPVHASGGGPAILLGHKMGSNSLWLQCASFVTILFWPHFLLKG